MPVNLIAYTFYEMLIKMKAENSCNFMPFGQKWVVWLKYITAKEHNLSVKDPEECMGLHA